MVSIPWEHSLTTLLGHDSTSDPGIALRQWVHFQGVHNILDLLSCEEEELKAIPAQQIFCLDDHGQGSYLRTNQVKQVCGLITYIKHVFREYNSGIEVREDPFQPFLPEEWHQHTSTMLRTFLIKHLPNPIGPGPVLSGPISSSIPTGYSPAAIELMGFKKGIMREISAYPSLRDERYFDGFKRSLFIVAKTHECDNVLLLIIGQGPPVLVKPHEYFAIRCTDAGFWSPLSGGIIVFVMGTSISRTTTNTSCCDPMGGMKLW